MNKLRGVAKLFQALVCKHCMWRHCL